MWTLLALVPFAAAEDLGTLEPYVGLRSRLRDEARRIAQGCYRHEGGAHMSLNLTVDGRGALQASPRSIGFMGVPLLPTDVHQCIVDGIEAVRVDPPPAGRPVEMCVPLSLAPREGSLKFKTPPTRACADHFVVREPEVDPMLLYREEVAKVVWSRQAEALTCTPGPATVELTISASGHVVTMTVQDPQEDAARDCLRHALIRWTFPETPGGEPVRVTHTFDAQTAEPISVGE